MIQQLVKHSANGCHHHALLAEQNKQDEEKGNTPMYPYSQHTCTPGQQSLGRLHKKEAAPSLTTPASPLQTKKAQKSTVGRILIANYEFF